MWLSLVFNPYLSMGVFDISAYKDHVLYLTCEQKKYNINKLKKIHSNTTLHLRNLWKLGSAYTWSVNSVFGPSVLTSMCKSQTDINTFIINVGSHKPILYLKKSDSEYMDNVQ